MNILGIFAEQAAQGNGVSIFRTSMRGGYVLVTTTALEEQMVDKHPDRPTFIDSYILALTLPAVGGIEVYKRAYKALNI